jgi:hypothetical protein
MDDHTTFNYSPLVCDGRLGHEVEVVSRLRTALRSLDETSRLRTYAKAQIQAISLIQRYRRRRIRPDLDHVLSLGQSSRFAGAAGCHGA